MDEDLALVDKLAITLLAAGVIIMLIGLFGLGVLIWMAATWR